MKKNKKKGDKEPCWIAGREKKKRETEIQKELVGKERGKESKRGRERELERKRERDREKVRERQMATDSEKERQEEKQPQKHYMVRRFPMPFHHFVCVESRAAL